MRRVVALVVIALLAVSLVGCGGGDTSTTEGATPTDAAAAPPAAPGAPAAAAPGADTKSPTEIVSNEPFPQTKDTPSEVLTRLENRQAMVLFFYDPSQSETAEQRAALDAVVEKYRGLIDLIAYDITLGRAGSDTEKDEQVQKVVDMAQQLKVSYTPYIAFVDRGGRVTYRFSGFTDQGLLEREALRATQ